MKNHHIILPDVQVKPNIDFSYLSQIGEYIAKRKPDIIINLGDFGDMPSLSTYDVGKKDFEGRSYKDDIECTKEAMQILLEPIYKEIDRLKKGKRKRWKPRMVFTLGNHEFRIDRAINLDRKLDGLISIYDLEYEKFGWEVIPFLRPISIDGICYAHYMVSGVMGNPIGRAVTLVNKMHMSTIVGHQQGRDIAYGKRADGKRITGIIAGSCYLHDEIYLNHQSNNHWRGFLEAENVEDGEFDEHFINLENFIKK